MRRKSFHQMNCSVARALEVVGEWWTMLIVRECLRGVTRFDQFQSRLGISSNILIQRLDRLVEADVLIRVPYQDRPIRHDYRLTDKGRDLWMTLTAIRQWGDRWESPTDPPSFLNTRRATTKPQSYPPAPPAESCSTRNLSGPTPARERTGVLPTSWPRPQLVSDGPMMCGTMVSPTSFAPSASTGFTRRVLSVDRCRADSTTRYAETHLDAIVSGVHLEQWKMRSEGGFLFARTHVVRRELRGQANDQASRIMKEDIRMADFPPPFENGILLTHFIVSQDVDRSRRFYTEVLGGETVIEGEPSIVALANGWIIINTGGAPTDDKPNVTLEVPSDLNRVSAFLNVRVADIQAIYKDWCARGAEFITSPIDRGAEIRCYLRDPDGHLIEVGQSVTG